MKFFYPILIPFLLLTGCNKDVSLSKERSDSVESGVAGEEINNGELNPVEYVNWVRDEKNGISKTKEINDVKFILQYKPHEYLSCMEIKSDTISKQELVKKEEEFKGMLYFDLKIHTPEASAEFLKYGTHTMNEYQQRVSYCSFNMQHDISLVQGTDTIPCSMYLFERAFDVAPEGTFLLGFDEASVDMNKEITLLYNDKLFSKGYIKFTYNPKTFKNLPKLKTV